MDNSNGYHESVYLIRDDEELLNQLNETHAELTCHLKKKLVPVTEGCGYDFDTVLCWPPTPSNSLAILPCLAQLNGIQYDTSRKYFRYFSVL